MVISSSNRKNPSLFFFFFFFFFFSCLFVFSISHAADTLTQGQSLRDGQTLVSTEETFALGFFNPENSSNRYVGIWYNKIPVQTVVWIANRDNPLSDSSGVLTVGGDGNLIISNGKGSMVWSSNVSIPVRSNCTAILQDSGNFKLSLSKHVDDSSKFLWQSYDNPTDTFLPGMKVGLNIRTGKNHIFTSWKSSSDPSMGSFNLGVDPLRAAQIVIHEGSKRHWRSGLWNGGTFIGVPTMRSLYIYGFKLENDNDPDGKILFTYAMQNRSEILRFRIGWDGREEQLHWDEDKKEWSVFWEQPVSDCDLYNKCGDYGICNMRDTQICSCPQGFIPKSNDEWSKGDWSSGCVRRLELKCERNNSNGPSGKEAKGDGFLQLDGMKLPDFSTWVLVQDKGECPGKCSANCSCRAYAYVDGIGCMIWTRDLVDIQKFSSGGYSLHLRLDRSELGGKKKISIILIVVPLIAGAILLSICVFLIWIKRGKLKDMLYKRENDTTKVRLNKSREQIREFSGSDDIGAEGNEGNGPELSVYSFNTVAIATDYFSHTNKLGQGGFGIVYKGKFPCGMEIAVKRLSRKSGQGLEEFKTEVILISKLQHRNLVRILGCCLEGEEKMLIYEYMPNKSLDAFIFDSAEQSELNWTKRFNIIEGIARGLLYLHRDSRLRIIHRDLKSSNILLDEEMTPKISDFGMAKIFGGNQNQANTNRVVGTYGYMAPEYAMEGLFSVKSDVYSFGVLLLEIISGKRNTNFHRRSENAQNLLGHAWQLWYEVKPLEFVDQSIRNTCSPSEVTRCIQLALLCVQDSAVDRPNMSSVVLMLESEATPLPRPKQPTFSIGRYSMDMSSYSGSVEPETVSTNDVTVSVIVGR